MLTLSMYACNVTLNFKQRGFFFCVAKFLVQSCHQISDFFPLVTSPLAVPLERFRHTECQKLLETMKGINSFVPNSPKDQMSFLLQCAYCLDNFQFLYLHLRVVLLGLYYFLLFPHIAYKIQMVE